MCSKYFPMLSCTRPSGLEVSAHFRHSHNALIQSNLQKASSYKSQSETNYLVNSSSKSFTHQLSTKQCLHILATQKASVCSGSIFLHIGKKSPALNIRFQLARLEVNCLVSCSRTSMYGHVCSDHPCKRSAKAQHLSFSSNHRATFLSSSTWGLPVDVCQAVRQFLGEERVSFTAVSVCRLYQFLFQRFQQRSHWICTKRVLEGKKQIHW